MAKKQARESQEQARHQTARQDQSRPQERAVTRREGALPSTVMPAPSPFTFMRRFMQDLDDLFGSFGPALMPRIELAGRREGGEAVWVPPVEIFERDGQLVIRADVPGLSRDEMHVEIQDGELIISGERAQEREERRESSYRSERVYGAFYRAIPLPEGVDPERARATFTNGVLEVTMPAPERSRPRRLEIQEDSGATRGRQQEAKSVEAKSAYRRPADSPLEDALGTRRGSPRLRT